MEKINYSRFFAKQYNKNKCPFNGHIELTYRCNFDCIHCYCKASQDLNRELSTGDWKTIIDQLQRQGCIHLSLSGGEPFVREDFLELYDYAKRKAFLITILTNAFALSEKVINYLAKYPPFAIEVTLNGIKKDTYESITQVPGSFARVMRNINLLAKNKLPFAIKTDLLQQNKNEVGEIKAFTERLLGKPPEGKNYFIYNFVINPRLNGDLEPTKFRISYAEFLKIKKHDLGLGKPFSEGLDGRKRAFNNDISALYQCKPLRNQFFISPYGRLKFCLISEQFSVDLRNNSFRDAFNSISAQVIAKKFSRNSKCKKCNLRPICCYCPARAYLETGEEQGPVPYYCEVAKATQETSRVYK